MDPVRVGLIGAGSVAQIAQLPALAALPDVVIAGVVTKTPESAARNLARWPIEASYASADEMMSDARLDAVFVLTPRLEHVRFVELALNRGLDVYCEKPLAPTLDDARRLASLSSATGALLMVGFNRRFAQVYQAARAPFADGFAMFCVAQKNRSGSEYRATFENAIHMVDLLRWFCGEPVEVTAHSVAPDPYREDGLMALIRFESGSVGALVAARLAGEWDERLDAYGAMTSARVVAPDSVSVIRDNTVTRTDARSTSYGWLDANVLLGFRPAVAHFIDCVRSRRQPLTNGEDASRTQELLERILAAAGLPLQEAAETVWVSRSQR